MESASSGVFGWFSSVLCWFAGTPGLTAGFSGSLLIVPAGWQRGQHLEAETRGLGSIRAFLVPLRKISSSGQPLYPQGGACLATAGGGRAHGLPAPLLLPPALHDFSNTHSGICMLRARRQKSATKPAKLAAESSDSAHPRPSLMAGGVWGSCSGVGVTLDFLCRKRVVPRAMILHTGCFQLQRVSV